MRGSKKQEMPALLPGSSPGAFPERWDFSRRWLIHPAATTAKVVDYGAHLGASRAPGHGPGGRTVMPPEAGARRGERNKINPAWRCAVAKRRPLRFLRLPAKSGTALAAPRLRGQRTRLGTGAQRDSPSLCTPPVRCSPVPLSPGMGAEKVN